MTTGQMLFVSGIVLLVFTIILGIIFWIKKPQYRPENVVYSGGDERNTQKLRNGYPTDPLTIRRESKQTAVRGEETELLSESQTDVIPATDMLQDAEPLDKQRAGQAGVGTVPQSEETMLLQGAEQTVFMEDSSESSVEGAPASGETELMVGDAPLREGDQ